MEYAFIVVMIYFSLCLDPCAFIAVKKAKNLRKFPCRCEAILFNTCKPQ